MCVFFRALSSNSVFINPIHWLQSVHWAVKSNSSLDKYAAGVSFHTQTHLFLLFMGHKLGCLSLCSLQHEVNVSALQAHKKKKRKKKKIRQENRKQNSFFCFLIFTEHLNKTGEPNTKGKRAVSVNDTLFVEHTRATPPNTKQRYKVIIKVKTFLSDTAEALEAWRGYASQSTRLFVFICV